MKYAIGSPGQTVRQYMETDDPDRAAMQCAAGEVAITVEDIEPWAEIAADGRSVTRRDAPDAWVADAVRAKRTSLLARCDWTVVADSPLSPDQQAAWRDYRQALRDVPADQPGASLDTIIWPQEPNA